jgi:metallo-beta-lactamase class B
LNPVSTDGFLFTQVPERLQRFQHSINTVRQFSCDIIISAHPGFTDLFEKATLPGGPRKEDSYVDKEGCKKYADDAAIRLAKRVSEESGK